MCLCRPESRQRTRSNRRCGDRTTHGHGEPQPRAPQPASPRATPSLRAFTRFPREDIARLLAPFVAGAVRRLPAEPEVPPGSLVLTRRPLPRYGGAWRRGRPSATRAMKRSSERSESGSESDGEAAASLRPCTAGLYTASQRRRIPARPPIRPFAAPSGLRSVPLVRPPVPARWVVRDSTGHPVGRLPLRSLRSPRPLHPV
jgi:hypothetical protein